MDHKGPENQKKLEVPSIEFLREELAREDSRYSFRRTILNIAGVLIVAAAITALVVTRIFVLLRVNGSSMMPTLAEREIIVLRQTKEVEKGDIIGFYYGGNVLLKRVIGSEGDYIEIDEDGNVYVNNEQIDEPYVTEKSLGKCEAEFPCRVPEEMYFVLGDNRAVSIDSRINVIGCVKSSQIVGRAAFRAWPMDRIGIMH